MVVANQKGYAYGGGQGNWTIERVVVGREEGLWEVVVGKKVEGEEEVSVRYKPEISVRGVLSTPVNIERH